MTSALQPTLDNLDQALIDLETAVEKRIAALSRPQAVPQLELTRDEREVSKKIAARLDMTIQRLETLLNEE